MVFTFVRCNRPKHRSEKPMLSEQKLGLVHVQPQLYKGPYHQIYLDFKQFSDLNPQIIVLNTSVPAVSPSDWLRKFPASPHGGKLSLVSLGIKFHWQSSQDSLPPSFHNISLYPLWFWWYFCLILKLSTFIRKFFTNFSAMISWLPINDLDHIINVWLFQT